MASSTKITYTQTTPTNNLKYTLSWWMKKSEAAVSATRYYMSAVVSGYANYWFIRSASGDTLDINNIASSGTGGRLITNRKFRDPNAWYHIVYVYDSANASATDRMRLYVNGVEETSFSTDTNPSSSQASVLNAASQVMTIGEESTAYFDGCMSHIQFVDGLALAPTEFGEFDSTSGIWKIKTDCYATPGANGFCLKMEDRTNLDLDSSSNAHTFTTTGTLTPTYDNPSNNFATLNPLENYYNGATFSNGNNTVGASGSNYSWNGSTLMMTSGKWYFEVYPTVAVDMMIGISGNQPVHSTQVLGNKIYQWGFNSDNAKYQNNAVDSAVYSDTWDSGDYMGVYLDLDNNKLYLGKNGVIQNSGTGVTITAPSAFTGTNYGGYVFAVGDYTTGSAIFDCNFGNGYFGTTAIGSPEADVGGIGAFKYDPSAGTFDSASKDFRALCTKNIKAYGG